MAFSVVGIQGHFSKTLLLFFMPQIFNFVLSCPQIFGFVPCPRHRVPRSAGVFSCIMPIFDVFCLTRFDADTNLLHPSTAQFPRPPSRLTVLILWIFSALGLTKLKFHPSSGTIVEATNLTILNFLLIHFGPMNEKRLVQTLMSVQVCHVDVWFDGDFIPELGCWQRDGICCAIRFGRSAVRWRSTMSGDRPTGSVHFQNWDLQVIPRSITVKPTTGAATSCSAQTPVTRAKVSQIVTFLQ